MMDDSQLSDAELLAQVSGGATAAEEALAELQPLGAYLRAAAVSRRW